MVENTTTTIKLLKICTAKRIEFKTRHTFNKLPKLAKNNKKEIVNKQKQILEEKCQ